MTTKRNTISVTLPDEDYDALKALADEQDRYISGQARHMLRGALDRLRNGPVMYEKRILTQVPSDDGTTTITTGEIGDDLRGPNAAQQEPLPG